MKIIIYLSLALYVLIVQHSTVMAQQHVLLSEAKRAAVQTLNLRQGRGATYNEARVKKINTLKNTTEKTLMYEAVFDDGQGVLLSGSKACLPVLGYFKLDENKSIFDDDMPDGLKSMLFEYREQIELCFKNDTIQLYHQNKWQALQQANSVATKSTKTAGTKAFAPSGNIIVAPLLTSHWGQSRPNSGYSSKCDAYNYYAPNYDCNDECRDNALAGCGAVAMAQIMYYWKYPVYSSYYDRAYNWHNMVDALNTNSSSYVNERDAIARLIQDCGDAVGMDFDCSSSTVNAANTRDAFVERFGYSSNADFQRRLFYSDATWKGRIKDNLNQGRPVLYSGQSTVLGFIPDPTKGHIFVCDGYSSDDMFHFNWGWVGNHETWLTIDDITPDGKDYNSFQRALFYLYPGGDRYCTRTYSGVQVTVNSTITDYNICVSNVTVSNGAKLTLDTKNEVSITSDFEVALGSEFEIK